MSDPNAVVRSCTILFLNLLLHIPLAASQPVCNVNGGETFATNSTYEANLNTLIASLSSAIGATGFLNASAGQSPDAVNAVVLCRGDISLPACRDCVAATAPATAQRCPNRKEAIFWNETCMVRYSARPIFGVLETEPVSQLPSTDGAPNPQRHDEELRALLESLRRSAASGGALKKVAAGNRSAADVQTIYALEQCTPDLSAADCTECLTTAIDDIPTCCRGVNGSGILRPSCTLRFENYRFYNSSMVEVSQAPLTEGGEKKSSNTTRTIIIIVAAVVGCLILAVSAIIFLRKRKKHTPTEIPQSVDEISTAESLQYAFSTIKAATNDFSDHNKLGQGGFGIVYKGNLSNGREIAVKRLSMDSGQGDLEFKNEVMLLAKLQHRNLVRLLGFAIEGMEKLLIYEFVQNASLDQFIFVSANRSNLDWDRRYKIIGGIARGILYLHEDSRLRIIHRDLKAGNILLDGEMSPKIADFGMARLFRQDETHANTSRVVGTHGYIPPEYLMHGQFSIKSDVFSFGVLVLEIISGKRNVYFQDGENVQDLLTIAWKNWQEGTPENIIDPSLLTDGRNYVRDIVRCIHMGLLCVQENAANRPTMASVVLMLSSATITLPLPSEPAFYMASRFGPAVSLLHSKESSSSRASNPPDSSRNDMSVTELYPR